MYAPGMCEINPSLGYFLIIINTFLNTVRFVQNILKVKTDLLCYIIQNM